MKFTVFSLFIFSICLTTSFSQTNTTVAPETTTTLAPETTTTLAPLTTTTVAPTNEELSFRIPKNESVPACLRANMSLSFDIKYTTKENENRTANVVLNDLEGYTGKCGDSLNSLSMTFKHGWEFQLSYTLVGKSHYQLSTLMLKYKIDENTFPNISSASIGEERSALLANQSYFAASTGNSYKCFSESVIVLNEEVSTHITHYQAQPFSAEKSNDFDTAVECPADITGTSKLVPIIVGSVLAALVVMVLVAYMIGKKTHRSGYNQVWIKIKENKTIIDL